jgi:repressor of nif and glnA expression
MKPIKKEKSKRQRTVSKHSKEIRKLLKNRGEKVSAKAIYYY